MAAPVKSWLDGYRQASFRGVIFYVLDVGNTGGNRNVEHQFPQRDTGYTEGMGRVLRKFRVDGHLIGDDFAAQWEKLRTALELGGPGTFVHPYYGNYTCNVGQIDYPNPREAGRMQNFTINFIESGQLLSPQSQTDPVSAVSNAASKANVSASVRFARAFSVLGQPAAVINAATSMVSGVGGAISAIIKPLTGDASAVATFATSVQALSSQATSLVQLPANLAQSIQGSIGQIAGVFGNNSGSVDAILGLAGFGASLAAVPTSTSARVQQGKNQGGMISLVQVTAIAEAARTAMNAAVSGGFTSADDAEASRDAVASALDQLMGMPPENAGAAVITPGATLDDDTYANLQDLRAQLYANIPPPTQQLPNLVSYQPATVLPILVIEYDIYEDDSLESDIITRNGIQNPGFVPANAPLQVLGNG